MNQMLQPRSTRALDPHHVQHLDPNYAHQLSSTWLVEDEHAGFDVWKYWFLVRKHLRLIATVFVCAVVAAFYITFTTVPLYTAQSLVLVKPKIPEILGQQALAGGAAQDEGYSENYYRTQARIVTSRSLAARVIENLNLANDPAFTGAAETAPPLSRAVDRLEHYAGIGALIYEIERLGSMASLSRSPISSPSTPQQEGESQADTGVSPGLINRYLSMLSVSVEDGTTLMQMQFTTPDPELSKKLANAHAEGYAQLSIDLHDQANQEVVRFLQTKLQDLKLQLEKSETQLNDYRREHDIIPGLMSLDGKEAVVLDRLRDLSKEMTDAEMERITLESQMQLINKGKYDALPSVANNPSIQALRSTLDSEYVEIASLSSQFRSTYQPLIQLEAKANQTKENLKRQIEETTESVRESYDIAVGKESALRSGLDHQKQEALGLNDAAVKYAMLQREVDTNRELTSSVLQRMKDVSLEAESEASNVSIVDRAEAPNVPSTPKKMRNLLTGGLLGLLLGIGLALACEYLSNTLNDPDEIERFLRLPNLAVIPEFAGDYKEIETEERAELRIASASGSRGRDEIRNGTGPESIAADAYRSLRTGLMLSKAVSQPKVTLVTSSIRGEGKTVTAINTSIMLAYQGANVLLIDADLRRGQCHRVLDMKPSPGLTEALLDSEQLRVDGLARPSRVKGLSVLPKGVHVPSNSTELIGSPRMRELLRQLSSQFDFLVLDSPPLIPVSDAMILSTMVDGVILVVDSSRTPKKLIKAARTRLEYAHAKMFGFVLNRMHPKSYHYHYYYSDYHAAEA